MPLPMDHTAARTDFVEQGFLVVPGFRSPAQLRGLRERAAAIVEDFDAEAHRSVFTTRDQARTADDWFLGSGDAVRCFFEVEAFDADARLAVPKEHAINKIGHAMHDLDPVYDAFSHGHDLASLAGAIGLEQPRIVQSMHIFKPPRIGGEVRWHQDATYLRTTPMTVTGFWFALEDATRDNGCLWVEPGGHRGPLRERFVRDGDAVRTETVDATPWPAPEHTVPLEVEAGTLVVFHGLLPHASAPNRSAVSRQAYTLHTVDAASAWAADNWLRRRPELPLRGFA
jgi:phytanoyl-CoA hydroxylase